MDHRRLGVALPLSLAVLATAGLVYLMPDLVRQMRGEGRSPELGPEGAKSALAASRERPRPELAKPEAPGEAERTAQRSAADPDLATSPELAEGSAAVTDEVQELGALRSRLEELQAAMNLRLNELFDDKFAASDYETIISQPGEETVNTAGEQPAPATQCRSTSLPDGRIQTQVLRIQIADHPDLAEMQAEQSRILVKLRERTPHAALLPSGED